MTTLVPIGPAAESARWRTPSYGLGIMGDPDSDLGRLWGHTGGGPGYATRLLPLDMYITGFQDHQFGQASAIATLLVIIGMLVSLALVRFSGFAKMRSEMEGA